MYQFKVLPTTYILSPLTCFSKKGLFEEISSLATAISEVDEHIILQALNQREACGATVCANGVGLPHTVLKGIDKSFAILAILQKEIPYHNVDTEHKGVDIALAFFFSTKEKYDYVEEMLSMISAELNNSELTNSLRRLWQDSRKLNQVLIKLDNILSDNLKVEDAKDKDGVVSTIRNFISEAIDK